MKISLCLIAKNEEKTLERCIASVKAFVNEIILVDTGSEDKTIDIARTFGANIYTYTWDNNFAAARNFALSKASGDWIVFLDGDEYFSEQSAGKIPEIIKIAHKAKFDTIRVKLININEDKNTIISSGAITRIFRNTPTMRYRGRIHEGLAKIKGDIKPLDASKELTLFHTGYSTSTIKEKNKIARNIAILYEELKYNPTSSGLHFYLVEALKLAGRVEEAYEHCKKFFLHNNSTLIGTYEKTYAHQLTLMIALNRPQEEIIKTYEEAVNFNKGYPDFDEIMSVYYANKGEASLAIEYVKRCLEKIDTYNSSAESWIVPNRADMVKMLERLNSAVKNNGY